MKMSVEDLIEVLSTIDDRLDRSQLTGSEFARLHDDIVRAAGWSMDDFYEAIDKRWDYVLSLPHRRARLVN